MFVQTRDPFMWLVPGLAGDEDAYRRYAESVMRDLRCFFAGRGCDSAEDLVSECLQRLIARIGDADLESCANETDRKRYLFGIARNVLREWRRRPELRNVGLAVDDPDQEGLAFSLPPINLISKQCLELLRQIMQESLAHLTLEEQDILKRSELDPEYSLAELADEKNTTAAAMRKRASRARMRLRVVMASSPRFASMLACLGMRGGRA